MEEDERDDGGHFVLSLLTSFTLKMEIGRLSALHNQDRDVDVTILEMRKTFRGHGWCQGVEDRPQIMRNTSKGLGYYFLLSNDHSASAVKAEWEASPLDQYIVASVQMRLRNCCMWNPKTPEDMQVWAKSLGTTFGGRRQFREHLVEGRAAVARWQVDFKSSQRRAAGRESSHTPIVVSTMCSSSSLAWSTQSCIRLLVRLDAPT